MPRHESSCCSRSSSSRCSKCFDGPALRLVSHLSCAVDRLGENLLSMVLELPPAPAALVLLGRWLETFSARSAAAFLRITVAGPPGGLGDAGRAVVEPDAALLTGEVGRGADCCHHVSTGCRDCSSLDRELLGAKTKAAPHLSSRLSRQQRRTAIAVAFTPMPAHADALSHVLCAASNCPLCARRCRK